MVPIAADWSDCVGLMVTTDCGLVSSLFLAAIMIFGHILGHIRAKTGAFGAPGRQEEARYHESNLGTLAQQPVAVETKSGSRGPSESLQDPQKGYLGPKRAILGPLGAKKRSNNRSKCVVTMSPTQAQQPE